MALILIIDDDTLMCDTMARVIKRLGHDPLQALTLQEGMALAAQHALDVVFLDVRLPDGNGLDLLTRIGALPTAPEVIIMTGYGEPDGAELAIKSGAWDYIEKSSSVKEISLSLERALQYRQQKTTALHTRTVAALKRSQIIGDSPKLNACLDLIAQAAGSDVNVFISGETGTGKELFARAVHENSQRARGNFVVVDCTALPANLVESLLFGHEKGTFTGAEKAKEGLIRQAHCGTLFLDEVGELPVMVQKAFLRVLQEHRYRPLGGNREIESDFRLVAATNRNLEQMVVRGQFREDLLFRLKSYIIELPPLRERTEDLQELARYYADRFCERYGIAPKRFSPEFITNLKNYSWPGNVREFVHTMERALASARLEPTLFTKHLPTNIRVEVTRAAIHHGSSSLDNIVVSDGLPPLPKLNDYREAVYADAEKSYLCDLLVIAGQNLSEACRISGLSQSRLYALIKKHDISRGNRSSERTS